MLLYRYRSIKSAVKELSSGSFYFASKEELNDPLESYVRLYWKGDKPAVEGLELCMQFIQCSRNISAGW